MQYCNYNAIDCISYAVHIFSYSLATQVFFCEASQGLDSVSTFFSTFSAPLSSCWKRRTRNGAPLPFPLRLCIFCKWVVFMLQPESAHIGKSDKKKKVSWVWYGFQIIRSMISNQLHKFPKGSKKWLHIKNGVECHHISYQAWDTLAISVLGISSQIFLDSLYQFLHMEVFLGMYFNFLVNIRHLK